MRKIVAALLVILCATILLNAQTDTTKKDTAWKAGGKIVLTISQASFSDWAAGGENSYAGNGRIGLFGNYIKGNIAWENNLDMAYGRANQGNQGLRKTDDLLEFNTKFGYRASQKWFWSVNANLRSQFDVGKKYDVDPPLNVSNFLSPLYVNLAAGADYKPNKYLSVFMTPLSTKTTYVQDLYYAQRYINDSTKHSRTDFGATVNIKYEKELITNLNLLTKLLLFADYKELNQFQDVDVNWEVLLTFKVFKVLSINLNTHLIWDKNVKAVNADGTLSDEARIQFKEIFGAGLAYNF